ncbi:MAG: hypothetical protein E6R08_00860 [Nevskiaceae bacterium]|nr:MAG: hypothetical protein E6R08_00860 [Nevskiaceae bacterium]
MSNLKSLVSVMLVSLVVLLAACSSTRDMAAVAKDQAKAEQAREEANEARLARKSAMLNRRLEAVPKWALEPNRKDGSAVYAVGFGESDKLQIALQKATLQAEFGLAKQYRQELSGAERLGQMDKGERAANESYTLLIDKLVASVPLNGAEVIEQEVKTVTGQYSAWVLLRISYDQMAKMASTESGAASDERMRIAFADLERRVRQRQQDQIAAEEQRQSMRIREMKVASELAEPKQSEGAPARESKGQN